MISVYVEKQREIVFRSRQVINSIIKHVDKYVESSLVVAHFHKPMIEFNRLHTTSAPFPPTYKSIYTRWNGSIGGNYSYGRRRCITHRNHG